MIPNNTTEFRDLWGLEPRKSDIMVMRFQRALQRSGMGEFDIICRSKIHHLNGPEFHYYLIHTSNVRMNIIPYDGNVHLRWVDFKNQAQFIDVSVPKNSRRFKDSVSVTMSFDRRRQEEFQESERIKKIRPFVEDFRPYLVSKGRIRISMENTVNDNGRVRFMIDGHFSLEEARIIMKGVEDSHVLDEHIMAQVMES